MSALSITNCYLFIKLAGSEKGLSQRVPDKYQVTRIPTTESQSTEYSTRSDYNLIAKQEPGNNP